MSFKEWCTKFAEDHWTVMLLFVLLLMLGAAHAFMLHFNRPESVINWCEGMITGTFTALVAKLKD